MKCPACKTDMVVVEYKRIELDYCPKCSGVWFDSGELELFLEAIKEQGASSPEADFFALPEVKPAEKKRKCPICGKKMKKTIVGENPKVLIDVCSAGDGLWFDGGEVSQVVMQLVSKPSAGIESAGVLSFLGDVFQARNEPYSET